MLLSSPVLVLHFFVKGICMKKSLWAAGLVVVIAGGVAGTVFTGKLVDAEYQRYIAAITENYKGVANVTSTVDAGLFGSSNTLSLEFVDLPDSVVNWAGTSTVNFDIVYSHGFLSSSSVMTIAKGDLLTKIQSLQVSPNEQPIVINSNYQYDFGKGQVEVVGDISLEALKFDDNEMQVLTGKGEAEFKITQGALELDWGFSPSELVSGVNKLELGNVHLTQSAKVDSGDVLTATITQTSKSRIVVDQLGFISAGADLMISEIALQLNQHIQGSRIVFDVDYNSAYFEADDKRQKVRFEKPHMQFNLDLDLASVIKFVEKMQELQHVSADAIVYPDQLLLMLSEVADQGVNFDLNKLSVALNDEELVASAKVKVAKLNATNAVNPIQRVDLTANLDAPKKFLEAAPDYNPAQLQFMVGIGVLVDAGDSYKVDFVIKDGQALMNGNPVPFF